MGLQDVDTKSSKCSHIKQSLITRFMSVMVAESLKRQNKSVFILRTMCPTLGIRAMLSLISPCGMGKLR